MKERTTTRSHITVRQAVRYAIEMVILAVGLTTAAVGAAGFGADAAQEGTSIVAATCVTPAADDTRQTPYRHNPFVL